MTSGTETAAVLAAADGPVLTLRINRPEKANAIDRDVSTIIARSLLEADADDRIRVVVITGTGDRFFSAGADIAALQRGESVLAAPPYEDFGLGGCTERTISKPVIAAVNGLALGGGFELALAADIIVADPAAAFAFPESRVGIFPGAGGVHRLKSRLPEVVATSLLLTGDRLPAADAAHHGLIAALAEAGEALTLAQAIAARIAQNAPLAVEYTKRLLRDLDNDGRSNAERDAWQHSHALRDQILASNDANEGFAAFLGRTEPNWSGT